MTSTSKFTKLHCKDIKSKAVETFEKPENSDTEKLNCAISETDSKKFPTSSTPVRKASIRDKAEDGTLSPVFMRFTQDNVDDDVDVVWDWDSPHSERIRFFSRKRIQHSSPKIPRKQILFEKIQPEFNVLKAQLENLVSQVNEEQTDDSDECMIIDNDSIFLKPNVPETCEQASDLFGDDSFDDEMIKCSQRVEEDFNISKWCTSIVNNNKHAIEDDAFDVCLEDINEDELLSQASGSSGNCSQNYMHPQVSKNVASPRAISRTNSVPVNFLSNKQNVNVNRNPSPFARTKSEFSVRTNNAETIKCSQEEIERKRQEAMALLERKRKQNEIERKRQEALERLKRNRMQRMQKNLVNPIKR